MSNTDDKQRAVLLERFQTIAVEYRQAKDNPGVSQLPISHSIEVLNLADVGFGVAYHLVPLLVAEITRRTVASPERDAHKLAATLDRWQCWVLRVVSNGAHVIHIPGITGSGGSYRIGDTFYMGGDPDYDAKGEAVSALIALGVLADLPMPDAPLHREVYIRLTDFGVLVAEQLVAIETAEQETAE